MFFIGVQFTKNYLVLIAKRNYVPVVTLSTEYLVSLGGQHLCKQVAGATQAWF